MAGRSTVVLGTLVLAATLIPAQPALAAASPSNPGAGATWCTAAALRLHQVGAEGAAGSVYITFRFRNRGSSACDLRGYPRVVLRGPGGVSMVVNTRETRPVQTIRMQPGQTAEFFLRFPNPGVAECSPSTVTVARVRARHTDQRKRVVLSGPLAVCPGTASRSPIVGRV